MTTALNYAAVFGVNSTRLGFAGLKVTDISPRTGIALSRGSLIEVGGLEVTIQNMGMLVEAVRCPLSSLLKAAGVEFIEENGGRAGVRLRTPGVPS